MSAEKRTVGMKERRRGRHEGESNKTRNDGTKEGGRNDVMKGTPEVMVTIMAFLSLSPNIYVYSDIFIHAYYS